MVDLSGGDQSMLTRRFKVEPIAENIHTMSDPRLFQYLNIKIHSLMDAGNWSRIRVEAGHDRSLAISSREKRDKLFNWQRPTAERIEDTVVLKCFPGRDYVLHYGLIMATYFKMCGRAVDEVTVEIPSVESVQAAVQDLKVPAVQADLVIVGWGLPTFTEAGGWHRGSGYRWKFDSLGRHRVLYVGFLHSIWGDVAGAVVRRLAELGARRVVYVGKVGSLNAEVEPNVHLATGNRSTLEGVGLTWDTFFRQPLASNVIDGLHVSSPSILLETKPWLASLREGDFVDPEIGHMGAAASEADIEFGYLHVISNNLARERDEDLSNERRATIVDKRHVLLNQIRSSILTTLDKRAITV